ncbi:DUF6221 family protein [Nocardia sp. NPDC059246]|uniref:DUF6221 family protein n=1 Tax=unclassified Nocardia TaxID=2637762 RepID=UPI0036AE8717
MTIAAFIEARLTEREAAAHEALDLEKFFPPDEFDLEYQWVRFARRRVRSVRRPGGDRALSSHFAPGAPSPREVLRECATWRAIVGSTARRIAQGWGHHDTEDMIVADLAPIAAIWAEHEDYRPEWAALGGVEPRPRSPSA